MIPIQIQKLHPDARLPAYAHPGDAGFDFYILTDTIVPGYIATFLPTGLAVAIPDGFELQIRLRSGIALNTPLIIPNAPATIDSGYRGELGIIVRNLTPEPFLVQKGERIAQGVLAKVYCAQFQETNSLPSSERGNSGYGSSGRL